MLRHERQTVAMELAAALHHSRDAGPELYEGLRAQTTASSGMRPAPLVEVSEPQEEEGAVTVGYVAAPMPTFALPVLAGSAGEAVDDRSLRFLLGRSLAEKKEEEEKRRKAEVEEYRLASLARARELYGSKRKRKKRRKRRLPRSPRPLLRGRAHRRQWLWHSRFACFPGDVLLRAVFPSELLGIMAVMSQKDSTTLVVIHGSGICWVGFTGHDAPRVIFPSGVAKPRMLCILAGMDQKDCFDMVPMVQTADTVESPQLALLCRSQLYQVICTPFVAQRQFLMVQTVRLTIDIAQLLYTVIDVPVVQVEQVHFPLVAECQILWSRLFVGPWTFHSCSTRWPMSLLCSSSRYTSPLWRSVSLHGPNCSFPSCSTR